MATNAAKVLHCSQAPRSAITIKIAAHALAKRCYFLSEVVSGRMQGFFEAAKRNIYPKRLCNLQVPKFYAVVITVQKFELAFLLEHRGLRRRRNLFTIHRGREMARIL